MLIIGRIYLSSQPMDGDPTQRAMEWWWLNNATILANPGFDYWEGYVAISPSLFLKKQRSEGTIFSVECTVHFQKKALWSVLRLNKMRCVLSES